MAEFADRIDELLELVGDGKLVSHVEVDQIYARYQHEGLDLIHPEGGKARYLADPLYSKYREYLQGLADHVLDEHDPVMQEAKKIAEDLSQQVYEHAPFEFGDLKASGHPSVYSDDELVYDRPPMVGRLSKEDLKHKSWLRDHGFGNQYSYEPSQVRRHPTALARNAKRRSYRRGR